MQNKFYESFDTNRIEQDNAGSPATGVPATGTQEDYRTPFQIDRDRIIHTSSFRRLQNKTQVFFSGEYDFYRTRLTHSIEVAQIGRSICNRLNCTSDLLGDDYSIDSDLVEAACLSHDIGHPPFGHTGERTLHRLMLGYGGFEGNAQTLRILTKILFGPGRGMNPSRALMDGVLKYKTLFGEIEDQKNHFIYAEQKTILDFVVGDEPFPESLPAGKPRNGFKSIECQIMDWADDTAYSLNDIADGIHAGFITVEKVHQWAEAQDDLTPADEALIEELIDAMRRGRVESAIGKKIGGFISAAHLEKSDGFLSGASARHQYRLTIDPVTDAACSLYKRISLGLVFKSRQLQQLDRKSDYLLSRLFEVFAEQYISPAPGAPRFKLLGDEEEQLIQSEETEAGRARLICDVLARMTDGIATRTYKRLFDADFGSIVDLI